MNKYEFNLQLFSIPLEETIQEMSREVGTSFILNQGEVERVKAAYLKGIEDDLYEALRKMEEDDFLLALQGIHLMSNDLEKMAKRQESMDASLKSIAESLKLIAGRM